MLDIKEEVQIALLKKHLSLRKISKILRDKGLDVPQSSGLSLMLNNKRIRFETVQQILDYCGFELCIREKRL